jgi:hypothetical protein
MAQIYRAFIQKYLQFFSHKLTFVWVTNSKFMKLLMLLILNLCLTLSTHAQFGFIRGLNEVGLTTGSGLVLFRGSDIYDHGQYPKLLENFGLTFQFDFPGKKRIKINSQILMESLGNQSERYAQRYNAANNNLESGTFRATIDLKYLTAPITLSYSFGKNSNFYVNSGLFVGYYFKGRLTTEEIFPSAAIRRLYTTLYDTKKYNFGGTVGMGYRMPIANRYFLSLELNGRFGLINISDQDPALSTSTTFKTNAVGVSIGFSKRRG